LGLVNVAKGLDPVNVANLLKKDFIQLGMQTIVIEVTIEQGQRIFLSFFGLFEGYLALGLVVGVAGVGLSRYARLLNGGMRLVFFAP